MARRLQGVIGTILEMAVGGVIRAGKTTYSDTAVGFWLGVDEDGLAKFNVGGSSIYMRWSGSVLEVAGIITWSGGRLDDDGIQIDTASSIFPTGGQKVSWEIEGADEQIGIWAGYNAEPSFDADRYCDLYIKLKPPSHFDSSDWAGIHFMTMNPAGTGYTAMLDMGQVSGTLGFRFNYRDVALTGYRLREVGDATAATDALNRQTGDGRYLQQSAGASGTFTTADGKTVTVTDGQITAIV